MGNTIKKLSIIAFISGSLTTGVTYGQFGWTTGRGDAQRAGWVRTDGYISVENLQQQRFGLEWKRKLDNAPLQMNSLTPGVSSGDSGWNVTPVNVGGSSNNVFGIEIDTGGVSWWRHFDAPMVAGTPACPGGMTAGVTRPTALNQIVNGSAGPFRGRGNRVPLPPIGGVGQPGEGVPMELMRNPRLGGTAGAVAPRPPDTPAATAPPRPAVAPTSVMPQYMYAPNLYVVTSDGIMHTLGLFLGKEVQKPAPFLPPNANVTDLTAINETLYAATINGCGGAPNGIWAMDLASDRRSVISWKNAASPVGAPAFDSNGTVYVGSPGTELEFAL